MALHTTGFKVDRLGVANLRDLLRANFERVRQRERSGVALLAEMPQGPAIECREPRRRRLRIVEMRRIRRRLSIGV